MSLMFLTPSGASDVGANILDQSRFARRAAAPGAGRRAALLALVLAPILAFGSHQAAAQAPTQAQARPGGGIVIGGEGRANLFEARMVPVDVTAANVTEARERALTQGRVAGLRQVVERLASRDDLSRLPALQPNQIIDMAQEFSLANERSSAVRYIADMTVRFNPDAVRRLLRGARIPFSEVVSKPMVIVPLYVDGAGKTLVWEDGNAWREAWAHLRSSNGLVPLILPIGDLQDMRLRTEQVLGKDAVALQTLATRYDAAGVIVAKATVGTADGVQIVLTDMRGSAQPIDMALSYAAVAGQSRDDILVSAANAASEAIGENWKKRSRIEVGQNAQITVLATLGDLKDWLRIRERLKDVPFIDKVDLQAITRDRAQVTLRYNGDQSRLENAMAQQNLSLAQQGGVWVLALSKRTLPAVEAPAPPTAQQ